MTLQQVQQIAEALVKHDPFTRLPLDLISKSEQAELVLKRKDQQQETSQAEDALF